VVKSEVKVLPLIEDEEGEGQLPERTKSRRERLSFVIANPDKLFSTQHKNISDTQLAVEAR
jgi:hypothetical protein